MRILTDFQKFPEKWTISDRLKGESRRTLTNPSRRNLAEWISQIRQADLIIVQQSVARVFWLALIFALAPFLRRPIVLVDVLLRQPRSAGQRVKAFLKRQLLNRVNHFIHYFQALEGYEALYGISPSRSSYIPFKANLYRDARVPAIAASEKEQYVFSAGWSLRDYDTFFAAIEQLPYPAAIPRPAFDRLRQHGARFTRTLDQLPPNLTLLDHDESRESWIKNLCQARVVVIPIVRETLCSAGISVYLDAMLLKKCVVISRGPGVSDVLTDQVVMVPPEDPAALAAAIREVWENATLRFEIAERGYRYAHSLGGETELMKRILNAAVAWFNQPGRTNS